jgi:hypothetical protein
MPHQQFHPKLFIRPDGEPLLFSASVFYRFHAVWSAVFGYDLLFRHIEADSTNGFRIVWLRTFHQQGALTGIPVITIKDDMGMVILGIHAFTDNGQIPVAAGFDNTNQTAEIGTAACRPIHTHNVAVIDRLSLKIQDRVARCLVPGSLKLG